MGLGKRFELPSFMTIVIAFVVGCTVHSFLQQVDMILLFDVVGSLFILSFPVVAVYADPTNRKAMKETELLVNGLEQPLFLIEKPRPYSVKDARS